jgi:hypothetical protein
MNMLSLGSRVAFGDVKVNSGYPELGSTQRQALNVRLKKEFPDASLTSHGLDGKGFTFETPEGGDDDTFVSILREYDVDCEKVSSSSKH